MIHCCCTHTAFKKGDRFFISFKTVHEEWKRFWTKKEEEEEEEMKEEEEEEEDDE